MLKDRSLAKQSLMAKGYASLTTCQVAAIQQTLEANVLRVTTCVQGVVVITPRPMSVALAGDYTRAINRERHCHRRVA